ncbi:hypothetical protein ACH41H_36405 [Streptomyces sp. NPDC020800]|uniref:hypothetical protein n=1 Tax=Streptomyces sp. NPDC020800 TaxID=3365092 RepID=UPI00379078AE
MQFDPNALIAPAVGLVAVPLGSWLNARATAKAEAKAERDSLGKQFDAMVHAVADLRAAVEADHSLWSSRMETVRAGMLASMAGLGVAAFAKGQDWRQLAAGAGGAGWFLAQERHQMKTATASLVPKLAAVAAAAAPLMRHSDTGIRAATDHFMTTAFNYHASRNPQGLAEAARDFGSAVQAALHPTRRRWEPWRRREQ